MKSLTVNTLIEIQIVKNAKEIISYKSRVEEIDARGIWIANPTFKGSVVLIPVGEEITAVYGDELCIYSFPSTVLSRVNNTLPMLLLAHPEPQNVTRIQRRDYVRIPAKVPVEFGIASPDKDLTDLTTFKANSVDISGGGLKLLTNVPVKERDLLQLTLFIEGEAILLYGTVIRANIEVGENRAKNSTVGVQFVNIHESNRDRIVKFVFNWQRQMRRRGLL
ncbi:MAG: flagellar brake domain-containing protein [Clostridia bacterium]|nr:flagellar brake domain-containing protein [Clostridia bacterium]